MAENKLIPVFMPSLASILMKHERKKGKALTKKEVIKIRNNSTAVMLKKKNAFEIENNRGYRDIDPENCWEEWQQLREVLQGREDI